MDSQRIKAGIIYMEGNNDKETTRITRSGSRGERNSDNTSVNEVGEEQIKKLKKRARRLSENALKEKDKIKDKPKTPAKTPSKAKKKTKEKQVDAVPKSEDENTSSQDIRQFLLQRKSNNSNTIEKNQQREVLVSQKTKETIRESKQSGSDSAESKQSESGSAEIPITCQGAEGLNHSPNAIDKSTLDNISNITIEESDYINKTKHTIEEITEGAKNHNHNKSIKEAKSESNIILPNKMDMATQCKLNNDNIFTADGEEGDIVPPDDVSNAQIWMMLNKLNMNLDRNFKGIKEDLGAVKKDITATTNKIEKIESWKTSTEEKLNNLETNKKMEDRRMKEIDTNNKQLDEKMTRLINAVSKQNVIIGEMQNKMERGEFRSMKQNLIINGIVEEENESCSEKVRTFLKDEIKVEGDILIKVAHRLGEGNGNRPMVVRFKNQNDKSKIYSNVSNLSKKVNTHEEPFYINDQLPARMNEKRIWEREIFRRNKKSVISQLQMSFSKGNLIINGEVYRPNVAVPDCEKILKATTDDMKRWKQQKYISGKEISKGNCRFIGYTRATNSFEEINDAYCHMKILHGAARHIVSVYRLAGDHPTMEGYTDDDEHGAGRKLLNAMRAAQIVNRVFFVARYYGGTNLGGIRFQGYREALESALIHQPVNEVTGKVDSMVTKAPLGMRGRGYNRHQRRSRYSYGGRQHRYNNRGTYGTSGNYEYNRTNRGLSPREPDTYWTRQKETRGPTEEEWQQYMESRFSKQTIGKLQQIQEAENYQQQVLTSNQAMAPEQDSEVTFNLGKDLTPISENAQMVASSMTSLTENWASPPLQEGYGEKTLTYAAATNPIHTV